MENATLPCRDLFDIPQGVLYLDGNSLGPLPKHAPARAAEAITREWGGELIRAWNTAGWMELPLKVANRIAPLIGAAEGSVATGDTLSIKVYQALAAALRMRPDRRVIVSDSGNFPTDLYMAQGLIDTLGQGHVLKTPNPDDVESAIGPDVAAVMLTQVDYSTGRRHDMARVTEAAHAAGAVMIWDLAHSAGAIEVDIAASGAEFAVGCTYKFLNGGPGAPAFIYVRPDIAEQVQPALAGWLGHEAPFAFDLDYRPAMQTERMRVGTPPIVQLSLLDAALDVWDGVSMAEVEAASARLAEVFIREVESRCPTLKLKSPRDPAKRGSQVSFAFPDGYAAMQALIERGVIGDFRAPDTMRFGITPLYLDDADMTAAAKVIAEVINTDAWKAARYQVRSRVT